MYVNYQKANETSNNSSLLISKKNPSVFKAISLISRYRDCIPYSRYLEVDKVSFLVGSLVILFNSKMK